MIDVIKYENSVYPKFQAEGNAAQFAIPFAKQVCKGVGFDIGFNRPEWKLPGAIGIDITDNGGMWHALNLPHIFRRDYVGDIIPILSYQAATDFFYVEQVDYIFSSHCLEHIPNWIEVLEYWISKLEVGGTHFLYLPDYSQKYWRPWNNRKHLHVFTPDIIRDFLEQTGKLTNIFVSGIDLNNSFIAIAEKL